MNPNDQNEEAQKLEIEKREETTTKEMWAILNPILAKAPEAMTLDDKRFLQARRSYISHAQEEEFKDVLEEVLPRPDGEASEPAERSLKELTRTELELKAEDLAVENPTDKKLYRTNSDLIKAIEEAQAQK